MILSRANVLLTGFGPFPGVPKNASTELVARLAAVARPHFPDHRFEVRILDTAWETTPAAIADCYTGATPVAALHFGVSDRARGFVIETLARNTCRSTPDCNGAIPSASCLDESAPGVLAVTISAEGLAARLRKLGLPVALSDDAGGYLCNAALFHSLTCAGRAGAATRIGFIHIPTRIGQPASGAPLDWESALEGGLEIIRAALDAGPAGRHR